MSKLYLGYLKEKEKNKEKLYLFKSGNFYLFIDEDARKISEITPLKLTHLTTDIVKCGFPVNSLDKYLSIFNNLKIDVQVISNMDNRCSKDDIIKKIKRIDINKITPLKALVILHQLKEMASE